VLTSELPLELRLKIWGMYEPQPFIVAHKYKPDGTPRRKDLRNVIVQRPVPIILQICKEARQEWLVDNAHNSEAAIKKVNHPQYQRIEFKKQVQPIYFCPEIDSLALTFASKSILKTFMNSLE
jgi:hypothetical protein